VSRFSVNQIINGKRSLSADMAVRLGHVTSTVPEFWLNIQREVDLVDAMKEVEDKLPSLKVLRKAKSDSDLIQLIED
jgi:plasmid maintenance system antidote protein VapI